MSISGALLVALILITPTQQVHSFLTKRSHMATANFKYKCGLACSEEKELGCLSEALKITKTSRNKGTVCILPFSMLVSKPFDWTQSKSGEQTKNPQ